MECMLCVPTGTDIEAIRKEYPDIYQDEGWDDHDRYFVGRSMEEEPLNPEETGNGEWMTYDECVEFCGFAEGAVEGSAAMIEGNGEWSQGEVTETDSYKLAFARGVQGRG